MDSYLIQTRYPTLKLNLFRSLTVELGIKAWFLRRLLPRKILHH
uniref:Uncharacterized protein n=1 Tax=Rhizophora mucronata TaxID=61149 RepID=A0A2P2N0C3_RHIMU